MRLNLGSGPRAVPGWVNIDPSPNIVLDREFLAAAESGDPDAGFVFKATRPG
jgi:hypothetical protein